MTESYETYTQHIRATRKAWAKLPKTSPLSETISTCHAVGLIPAGDLAAREMNLRDLADGQIVYLPDGTQLRMINAETVRHWG